MKHIFHTGISLYITSLAAFNIAVHGADTIIQLKTKEDLKEFYFKYVHLKPEELDQQFDRNFFKKNPLSIPVIFPADCSDEKPKGRPISNWCEFIERWKFNCHVSLLEGIFTYVNYTDPDQLIYLHDWLSKFNEPFKQSRTLYGDFIPGLLIAKTYKYEIPKQKRQEAFLKGDKDSVYRYTIASEDVGKAIFNHSSKLTDDVLKLIAPSRPNAIAAFLRMYEPHYALTVDQTVRFKKLGFHLDERQDQHE